MSCGVDCRHGSDPMWLWHRPAAVAPVGPLVWELPCAASAALKSKNIKIKREACGIQDMGEYPVFQGGTIKGGELERVGGGRG